MPGRAELRAIRTFSLIAGALPWGAGQYRLAQPYSARERWPEGSFEIQKMVTGARFRLDLNDRVQIMAYLLRDYAPDLVQCILDNLPYGGTFVDVGGHVGMVSLTVAVCRPDVAVHAFEPNPKNAASWRYNQILNGAKSARLTEVGLSDHQGTATLAIPSDSGSGMILEGGAMSVPITTLDQYCDDNGVERIDIMKIDVQGHEPAVLQGAMGLLRKGAIRAIICEMCEPLLEICGWDRSSVVEPLELCSYMIAPMPQPGLRRFLPPRFAREPGDLLFKLPPTGSHR